MKTQFMLIALGVVAVMTIPGAFAETTSLEIDGSIYGERAFRIAELDIVADLSTAYMVDDSKHIPITGTFVTSPGARIHNDGDFKEVQNETGSVKTFTITGEIVLTRDGVPYGDHTNQISIDALAQSDELPTDRKLDLEFYLYNDSIELYLSANTSTFQIVTATGKIIAEKNVYFPIGTENGLHQVFSDYFAGVIPPVISDVSFSEGLVDNSLQYSITVDTTESVQVQTIMTNSEGTSIYKHSVNSRGESNFLVEDIISSLPPDTYKIDFYIAYSNGSIHYQTEEIVITTNLPPALTLSIGMSETQDKTIVVEVDRVNPNETVTIEFVYGEYGYPITKTTQSSDSGLIHYELVFGIRGTYTVTVILENGDKLVDSIAT